jgi:hypothetical protein
MIYTDCWRISGRTNEGTCEWQSMSKRETDKKCVQGLCEAKFRGKMPL